MWYNWLLLYTEWLRRRCYCFVRSCCYKRDYPVGTEEPAQEQRRLVQIRSKTLLSEVLRGIGANEARYSCRAVADGYVGFAEATVYGGPDADDLSHREVGVFYDVHRLGEYAESFVDEGLANLTSVAARYI
uniref:Uncharacterized protein n=1 Tax=Oryza rufipogon TaxID=4529 RepID=A0A0E0RIC4_ORYRU